MVHGAGPDLRCARSSGSWRTPGRRRSPRPPRSCPPTPRSRCCTSLPATSRRSRRARATGCSAGAGTRAAGAARAVARDLRRGRRGAAGRGARALRTRRAHRAPPRARRSARWSRPPRAWTCSSSRATATIRAWVPRSLGPAARFVVDHAPCRVLLVWADAPPRRRDHPAAAHAPATPPLTMQNVHAMRPEVRADYERALAQVAGDDAFAHALRALLHRAARPARRALRRRPPLRGAWRRAAGRDRAHGGRARRARCARSTTSARSRPDWLQREQAVGYVTYVDRFAGTLSGRARAPALPARAGRQLPAPDAAAARAAGAQRRRLRGRRLRRGRAGAGHDGGPARAGRRAARARAWRCASTSCSTTRRASTRGRGRRWPATSERSPSTGRSRIATEPDAYELHAPRGLPGHRARQLHVGSPRSSAGSGRPSTPTSGTSTTRTPRCSGPWPRRCSAWPPPASTCCASTPSPFLWKRKGTNCQNQPEVHELLQAFRAAHAHRRARGRLQGRGDRLPARPRAATSAPGRHEGKECDLAYHNVLMVLLWSALASGRVALLTSTLRAMPPVPPGAGWVTYVRCHDDIGWAITEEDAGAVGEDAHLHRRFLVDFYAGDFPASFARGARFQPDPATGEARTSGTTASLAGLEAALDSGDAAGARAGAAAHPAALRGGLRTRRAAARSTWATSSGCATITAWEADPARRDDNRWMHRPAMDWDGGRAPRGPASRSRAACGTACAGSSPRAAPRAPPTRRAPPSRCGPATTTSSACCASRPAQRLLLLANFTPERQPVDRAVVHDRGLAADSGRRGARWACGGRGGRPPRARALSVPVAARLTKPNTRGVEVSPRLPMHG